MQADVKESVMPQTHRTSQTTGISAMKPITAQLMLNEIRNKHRNGRYNLDFTLLIQHATRDKHRKSGPLNQPTSGSPFCDVPRFLCTGVGEIWN